MAAVTGIGVATPPPVAQEALWDGYFRAHTGGGGVARRIFAGSGVRTRHTAVDPFTEDISGWSTALRMDRFAEQAPALATSALADALADAGRSPADLGLLVVVSCTGYSTPGLDIALAERLGLAADTQRLLVGHMGCYAAIPGLGTVSDFATARGLPAALVCVELTSLHVQPPTADPEQVVAHALFSDAAAAVVVEPGGQAGWDVPGWEVLDIAAHTDTDTQALMTWRITDLGFRMGLSARVPDALAGAVRPVVDKMLARHGADVDSVAGWAVHPGGPRVLDVVRTELGLSESAMAPSRKVLAEHGNCSSATVVLVLREVAARPGELVVAMAFGPGLTLYAAVLRRTG
ncbi:type III polyketide synthase [Actinokineospora globicatena]|uniref:type III polyketide synthase n=1 Tax=Actinokineospora globicatena TaxID=103729 RepID=UPI0020A540F5|nr:type III polyketide synthase [Actinokineospora globicatena]MCP2306366.1 putative naringenin-chalcone synthase [Actinokineospora globicatena]GLW81793.1 chalcone synthase [Actinokineospora globicatena]GLW88587.1 chalcone synthase [Actinokineospora globicatena]